MAKYTVTFSCGHTEVIQLNGKDVDRQRKIKYFEEQGMCKECYKEMLSLNVPFGCEEVEMHYSEYKNNYSDCETKVNSYNKETKTIVVYVLNAETIKEQTISKIDELKKEYQKKGDTKKVEACEKLKKDFDEKFWILPEKHIIAKRHKLKDMRAFVNNYAEHNM